MPVRRIVHFAQAHAEFRLPELQSIAELFNFQLIKPPSDVFPDGIIEDWDPNRPFWVMDFEEDEHALRLAERCILVKAIYEYYATGKNYDSLHEQTLQNAALWERHVANTSFRITVNAYNHSIPFRRVQDIVEGFEFLDFKGIVDLKTPECHLVVNEEYPNRGTATVRSRDEGDGQFLQVYFGRLITEGSARALVKTFDVKKRKYFGNTSMEAEISLLMANQTLASPGKFIYDPFMGTGSLAYTTAHFGAFVFGSDIDGRQMRGKGTDHEPGILRSASQYGVAPRIIDLCTFDVTNNPLRVGGLFDAIVTDPPYGVRAGAKRLGRKPRDKRINRDRRPEYEEAQKKALIDFVPPTQPYELSALVSDLVRFARYLLRPAGRLVFFLPTVTDEYEEVDVQALLCPGMVIVANSVQDFGSWGRRLITIKKITLEEYESPFENATSQAEQSIGEREPAHKDFREKYFRGFRKEDEGRNRFSELTAAEDSSIMLPT